ncbi:CARP motif [Fusarium oxysporum f. sp. vasinfectum]|uniref:Adenylyl cyclase-associated protein n=1 Tax=Fusarium oxysporum f. sp. radicis-cucumerinum TaxID=327505 RepID=A0A2H3HI48_FUSOX|nr:CARP motif [Fusarium oxysporum f. sp. vasinfectum]PCD42481.1 hypothetical protein AU210_005009 [Fusarium oxysporum f. sp. radicis-cucumerinum]
MAANSQMHNLTTLIKRLEAATSRLEDIASSTEPPADAAVLNQAIPSPPNPSLAAPPPPAASDSKATTPAAAKPEPVAEPLPESIEEFDAFLNTSVDKYVKLSHQLGGLVAEQAALVKSGFQEQRKFLLISTKAKKPNLSGPDLPVYESLIKPINEALMAVTELKDANRPSPMYTQLSTVSDGIMVLAWVTIDTRPYKHVDECLGSAQFFGNRVLKEQKDKDPKQIEWVQSFYQMFRDLADYVKQYFPTDDAPAPASSGGFGAVFSELNKGDAVTKGLRKVDKSEMTHKNPSLRSGSTVSSGQRGKSPAPGKKPKPESMRIKKPAKKELEGNKWTIENYEKEAEPIEIEASLTHSVLISRCNNTTIIVRGKANQVTVENSTRLSLIVDTLVSTVDVVKANNFALQVMGTIPTVMLDQVDSAQIYFSKESIGTKVFTSKSAGVNLNVISGEDDDYKEVPLPSQICSYYDESKGDLVNEIVAHAG